MKILAQFDGSCWPNPHGVAGYGFVVYRDDVRIHDGRATIGRGYGMTNNVAESAGLCALLDYLIAEQFTSGDDIVIQGDSMIAVRVARRKYQPKGFYAAYALKSRGKLAALELQTNVRLEWIPREMNGEADELSQVVIDEHV